MNDGRESEGNTIIGEATDATQAETTVTAKPRQGFLIAGVIIGVLVLLGLIIAGVIYLAQPATPTARIRDIFIIFIALEFLVLGLALIILIVQVATLINLLQNEIKPILESTTETTNTLRGTAIFLSDNLVEPVIKLSGYVAGLQRMVGLIGGIRKVKTK